MIVVGVSISLSIFYFFPLFFVCLFVVRVFVCVASVICRIRYISSVLSFWLLFHHAQVKLAIFVVKLFKLVY